MSWRLAYIASSATLSSLRMIENEAPKVLEWCTCIFWIYKTFNVQRTHFMLHCNATHVTSKNDLNRVALYKLYKATWCYCTSTSYIQLCYMILFPFAYISNMQKRRLDDIHTLLEITTKAEGFSSSEDTKFMPAQITSKKRHDIAERTVKLLQGTSLSYITIRSKAETDHTI